MESGAKTSLQVEDGVCNSTDCFRDEPDDLVRRRFKGTDLVAQYCRRHDPLDDPKIADMWEVVDDWF